MGIFSRRAAGVCGAALLLILILAGVAGGMSAMVRNREFVVGKDIAPGDVREFYYTRAASTYPPEYQRYHFYIEDGQYGFSHERREGEDWPLTQEHATLSGTVRLTEEDWERLLGLIRGGRVRMRREHTGSGGSGPWLYLCWEGDGSRYQEFSFASRDDVAAFEEFCAGLAAAR